MTKCRFARSTKYSPLTSIIGFHFHGKSLWLQAGNFEIFLSFLAFVWELLHTRHFYHSMKAFHMQFKMALIHVSSSRSLSSVNFPWEHEYMPVWYWVIVCAAIKLVNFNLEFIPCDRTAKITIASDWEFLDSNALELSFADSPDMNLSNRWT